MLDDHDIGFGEHDGFVDFLNMRETLHIEDGGVAGNDDLGLDLSEPSLDLPDDLPSESLTTDAVIASELACLDSKTEVVSSDPVNVSVAVQVASQTLGCSDFWNFIFILFFWRFVAKFIQTSFLECQCRTN